MAAFSISALAGEHATAASTIDRALALNPYSAHAWMARGWVSCYQSQPVPAIAAFERAMRLSPLDPTGFHTTAGRALPHVVAGQYSEAIEWADRSLSELPRYGPAIRTKVVASAQMGRIAEAQESLARMIELQPGLTIGLEPMRPETLHQKSSLWTRMVCAWPACPKDDRDPPSRPISPPLWRGIRG